MLSSSVINCNGNNLFFFEDGLWNLQIEILVLNKYISTIIHIPTMFILRVFLFVIKISFKFKSIQKSFNLITLFSFLVFQLKIDSSRSDKLDTKMSIVIYFQKKSSSAHFQPAPEESANWIQKVPFDLNLSIIEKLRKLRYQDMQ